MRNSPTFTPIHRIQGSDLLSPLSGKPVTTRGVVIGATRKGYFIQDPDGDVEEPTSHGILVFERRNRPPLGSLVEVSGKVVDYRPDASSRPTTQLVERSMRVLEERGPIIEPVWLSAERVLVEPHELAVVLNNLEGMLVGIAAGATFVAPSNSFGDYVLLPPGSDLLRTEQGGVLIDPRAPERWLPGFRVLNYAEAPTVNVGARLLDPVVGPLNFRVASYQMAAVSPVRASAAPVETHLTSLRGAGAHVTVLTLNGFNLDMQKEDRALVNDPGRDVDDDVGDRRFIALGEAIVKEAACPTIVALQEIQDDDGAELSDTVRAQRTYRGLIVAVQRAGGPTYAWADIAPEVAPTAASRGATSATRSSTTLSGCS